MWFDFGPNWVRKLDTFVFVFSVAKKDASVTQFDETKIL